MLICASYLLRFLSQVPDTFIKRIPADNDITFKDVETDIISFLHYIFDLKFTKVHKTTKLEAAEDQHSYILYS